MSHWNVLSFAVLFIQQSLVLSEDVKTWNADTNFVNPRNWVDNKIPCQNDRVVFPADARVISFVPSSMSIAEMILPMNSELVLKEGVNIEFTGGKLEKSSCAGKDSHFRVNEDFWYDPVKWNVSTSRTYPQESHESNMAIPHADQVPCSSDVVLFSRDTTFRVRSSPDTINVASFKINGMSYDDDELKNLLASRTGNLLFPDSPKISVSGSSCSDHKGCLCDRDYPKLVEKVCSHVTQCPIPQCSTPIKPYGHCCHRCAYYLDIEIQADFQMSKYIEFLHSLLANENFQNIHVYTGRVDDLKIQTVLVDTEQSKSTDKSAKAAIFAVFRKLRTEQRGGNTYRLRSVVQYAQGPWFSDRPSHSPYTGNGISAGGVVAIVFIVAVAIGAVVLWYIYKRRQIPGFSFARFDLQGGKIELELGTTPHEDLDPEETAGSADGDELPHKAFDNPVYDTAVQASSKVESLMPSVLEENEDNESIVENPMYAIYEAAPGEVK